MIFIFYLIRYCVSRSLIIFSSLLNINCYKWIVVKMNWDACISKGRPQKFSFCLLVVCSRFLDFCHQTAYDTRIHPLSVNKIKLCTEDNFYFKLPIWMLIWIIVEKKFEKRNFFHSVPVCDKREWRVLYRVVMCVFTNIEC